MQSVLTKNLSGLTTLTTFCSDPYGCIQVRIAVIIIYTFLHSLSATKFILSWYSIHFC